MRAVLFILFPGMLNVETLPMGLVHVVLQGSEEKRSGKEEGMEWSRKEEW